MKNIIVFVILLLVTGQVTIAQQTSWQQVSPTPQGNTLEDISVVDQNTVFACGASGTFMSSSDGGETWYVDQYVNGITETFYAVSFVNSQVGWLGGESGVILKTTDGGKHWKMTDSPSTADILSFSFISPTTGWACGSFGLILKTTDGGGSWVIQTSNTDNALTSSYFVNENLGFMSGGNGTVLKTTNGGTNWSSQSVGISGILYSIHFTDANNGWTVGENGTTYRTTNGGNLWTFKTDTTGLTLSEVQFISSTTGWVAGYGGAIWKTTNTGVSWAQQTVDTYKDFFSMRFINANTGWAIGDYGIIFKTTNGGSTWFPKSSVAAVELYSTYYPSTLIGYQVGEYGNVYKTTDGGYTWVNKRNNIALTYSLWGVTFLNDDIGWVVGDSGYIAKTANGGGLWFAQSSGLENAEFEVFYSVFFFDQSKGWIGGDYGTILKTTNGGLNWVKETTDVSDAILKIKFINTTTGWAVGTGGTILKTTDGGVHWFEQASNLMSETLYSIEVVDQNTVYVCGDNATVLRTTNGGTTWQQIVSDNNLVESFYDLAILEGDKITLVGDDGLIYGSTNTGFSWGRQQSNSVNRLWSIQIIPARSGAVLIVTGEGSTILKSALSPLPVKRWNGTVDSLWTTAGNWVPAGIPEMYDSVYVPATGKRVTLRHNAQKVNIGSLFIASGGSMYIGSGISEFNVAGGIILDGRLEIASTSRTDLIAGGGFLNNGTLLEGVSPIVLNGGGYVKGTFTNLTFAESSKVATSGNVIINGVLSLNSILTSTSTDTVTITTTDTLAIRGNGLIEGGTVKRAIASGSTSPYRFGSPVTTVTFLPGGTTPTTVLLTSFPGFLSPEMSAENFVKRYYVGKTIGGSNFKANVSLSFNEVETTLFPDEVGFFKDSSGYLINLGNSDYIYEDYMATILDSISEFSTWYLGSVYYYPKSPLEVSALLVVTDNGALFDTLRFGSNKLATDALDAEFAEQQLGAKPALGTFDVRWVLPGLEESKIDFRPLTEGAQVENIFKCDFQPGAGGYPVQLKWKLTTTPSGTLFLQDASTGGAHFSINMKNDSLLTISDTSIKQIQIVQKAPFFVPVLQNWNIVSMPLTPITSAKQSFIFPTAISRAFGFGTGYTIADTLQNGKGYWLKFYRSQNIGIEGFEKLHDTMNVSSNWNIIGSISKPVAVNSINQVPSGIVSGLYYGYQNGYYITDSIRPGRGYWIKLSNNGKLILSASSLEKYGNGHSLPDADSRIQLTIRDNSEGQQELYFAEADAVSEPLSMYEMPPAPYGGMFDARFSSNRILEPLTSASSTIEIRSNNYPVTVSLFSPGSISRRATVVDARRGTMLGTATSDGKTSVTITDPSVNKINVTLKKETSVPKEFDLQQNYPNPFNPITHIQFSIPERARVTLEIFNVLGQRVALLAENVSYNPGSYVVQWDAAGYASGMYFYKLTAGKPEQGDVLFNQVKKMVVIK